MRKKTAFQVKNLDKVFQIPSMPFYALKDIHLEVDTGQMVFVVGRSGSGKSTLLNMIAGLDQPSRGSIEVCGQMISDFDEDSLAVFRGKNIGVVFQFFQLLPTLTIIENVMLAMDFVGQVPKDKRYGNAMDCLRRVEIQEQAHKLPATLSGGQQQRAAIARALANDPLIVVADEPTGNLDSHTADTIMGILKELVQEKKTVLMVTHNNEFVTSSTRLVNLVDGRMT